MIMENKEMQDSDIKALNDMDFDISYRVMSWEIEMIDAILEQQSRRQ